MYKYVYSILIYYLYTPPSLKRRGGGIFNHKLYYIIIYINYIDKSISYYKYDDNNIITIFTRGQVYIPHHSLEWWGGTSKI